jgi:glycosyltransferase involved in cell wall biosynthesis
VDRHFFSIPPREAERSRPPYLLALGTIEPRKNVPRIVAAFERIAERHPGLELIIAGRWGWLYKDVQRAVRASPVRARIKLPGFVAEEQLGPLLRDAQMLLYPSLMEGFGLPILEGMAAGRPVLTSDREPLRSVAGGAARLVDPEDVESIADGMQQLLCDEELRSDLIRRGREHARRFSWEACAAQTQRVYEAVAR